MKVTPINNSPKFKGYTNVLHATCEDNAGRVLSYMSMRLDNAGRNDLQQWHNIQRKLFLKNDVKDTLTFAIFKDEIEEQKHLIIDRFGINIENKYKFDGSAFDRLLIDAMLFVQNITHRIKTATSIKSDNNFNKTLDDTTESLSGIFGDKIFGRLYAIEGIKPDSLIINAAKKMDEDVIEEIRKIY